MTTTQPPFPISGHYLHAIRQSSKDLRTRANIKITKESIHRLLTSPAFTTSFKRVSAVHGLILPLKFDSFLDELNLISILSLLNFASGYRVPLHEQLRRGAWDSIRAFVFSLYITSSSQEDLLSSQGMKAISMAKVAELMGINLHIEKPHPSISGLVIGELGGPLYELVKLVTHVLNDTGAVLVNGGYPNLGSFVLEALKEGGTAKEHSGGSIPLEVVLERLVKAFSAFQDMAIIDEQPIYCFKKALFLIHAIRVRFASKTSAPFPIPETKDSPVFTDNVLPSLLVHLGVIELKEAPGLENLFPDAGSETSLEQLLSVAPAQSGTDIDVKDGSKKPPKEGPIITRYQAFKLRAAAIDACELIVAEAQSMDIAGNESLAWINDITLLDLDMWLWSIAKDRPDYRSLERFAERDTVYF